MGYLDLNNEELVELQKALPKVELYGFPEKAMGRSIQLLFLHCMVNRSLCQYIKKTGKLTETVIDKLANYLPPSVKLLPLTGNEKSYQQLFEHLRSHAKLLLKRDPGDYLITRKYQLRLIEYKLPATTPEIFNSLLTACTTAIKEEQAVALAFHRTVDDSRFPAVLSTFFNKLLKEHQIPFSGQLPEETPENNVHYLNVYQSARCVALDHLFHTFVPNNLLCLLKAIGNVMAKQDRDFFRYSEERAIKKHVINKMSALRPKNLSTYLDGLDTNVTTRIIWVLTVQAYQAYRNKHLYDEVLRLLLTYLTDDSLVSLEECILFFVTTKEKHRLSKQERQQLQTLYKRVANQLNNDLKGFFPRSVVTISVDEARNRLEQLRNLIDRNVPKTDIKSFVTQIQTIESVHQANQTLQTNLQTEFLKWPQKQTKNTNPTTNRQRPPGTQNDYLGDLFLRAQKQRVTKLAPALVASQLATTLKKPITVRPKQKQKQHASVSSPPDELTQFLQKVINQFLAEQQNLHSLITTDKETREVVLRPATTRKIRNLCRDAIEQHRQQVYQAFQEVTIPEVTQEVTTTTIHALHVKTQEKYAPELAKKSKSESKSEGHTFSLNALLRTMDFATFTTSVNTLSDSPVAVPIAVTRKKELKKVESIDLPTEKTSPYWSVNTTTLKHFSQHVCFQFLSPYLKRQLLTFLRQHSFQNMAKDQQNAKIVNNQPTFTKVGFSLSLGDDQLYTMDLPNRLFTIGFTKVKAVTLKYPFEIIDKDRRLTPFLTPGNEYEACVGQLVVKRGRCSLHVPFRQQTFLPPIERIPLNTPQREVVISIDAGILELATVSAAYLESTFTFDKDTKRLVRTLKRSLQAPFQLPRGVAPLIEGKYPVTAVHEYAHWYLDDEQALLASFDRDRGTFFYTKEAQYKKDNHLFGKGKLRHVNQRIKNKQRNIDKYKDNNPEYEGRKKYHTLNEELSSLWDKFHRISSTLVESLAHKLTQITLFIAKNVDCPVRVQVEDLSFSKHSKRSEVGHFLAHNQLLFFHSQLQSKLAHLLRPHGIGVWKVNPYHSSQQCALCGYDRKGQRKGKTFTCHNPDHQILKENQPPVPYRTDSDLNASRNIWLFPPTSLTPISR